MSTTATPDGSNTMGRSGNGVPSARRNTGDTSIEATSRLFLMCSSDAKVWSVRQNPPTVEYAAIGPGHLLFVVTRWGRAVSCCPSNNGKRNVTCKNSTAKHKTRPLRMLVTIPVCDIEFYETRGKAELQMNGEESSTGVLARARKIIAPLLSRSLGCDSFARISRRHAGQFSTGRPTGERGRGLAALRIPLSGQTRDPKVRFYMARQTAAFDDPLLANQLLLQSCNEGFYNSAGIKRDPWFEPLRAAGYYQPTLEIVTAREEHARSAFVAAGGDRVLRA